MDESVLVENREISVPRDGIGLAAGTAEILETPPFACARGDFREDVAVHSSIRKCELAEDVTRPHDDPDLLRPGGADSVFPFPDDGGQVSVLWSGDRGRSRCVCSALDQKGGREFADAIGEVQAHANEGCRSGCEYSNRADSQGSRNGRGADGEALHAALAIWTPNCVPAVVVRPRMRS